MLQLLQHIRHQLHEFEVWFEKKFGWFFTNGMKQDQPSGPAPATDLPKGAATKA